MFIMDEWPITHHHNRLAFILRMGRQGLIEASAKQEILRFLGVFGGASHQNYMKIIIPKDLSIIIIHNDNTSLVRAWEGNGGE